MKENFLSRAGWGFALLAGAAVVLLVWFTRDILIVIFAGVLLGVCLRAPAEWLNSRTGLSKTVGVCVFVLMILILATGAGFLSGNVIARQVDELVKQLPIAVDRLEAQLLQTSWGQTVLTRIPSFSELIPTDSGAVQRITGFLSSTLYIVVTAFLIVFLGLTLALNPGVYTDNALLLVPPPRRERIRKIMREVTLTLRWWTLGRLISMTIIGVLTFIGLKILGIPLAGVLALLAAFLSFIPNLGPILSAVPAVLLGLLTSVTLAIYVAIMYLVVQAVETYLLAPIIDRKTVSLPPALTITVQLLFGSFLGLLGVAMATPILAATVVAIRMGYVEEDLTP